MKLADVTLHRLTAAPALAAALLLLVALLPATGFSQEVTGTFVVKGASTPFRYVYAYWKDQAPFKKDVMNLYVLLSDVPVDAGTLPSNDRGNEKMAELVRRTRSTPLNCIFRTWAGSWTMPRMAPCITTESRRRGTASMDSSTTKC